MKLSESIMEMPVSQFCFEYAEAMKNYNEAYTTKKLFEDEMQRRHKAKLDTCLDSKGKTMLNDLYKRECIKQLKEIDSNIEIVDVESGEILEEEYERGNDLLVFQS